MTTASGAKRLASSKVNGWRMAVELTIRPSTASTLHFPPPMAKPLALVFDTSAEALITLLQH